jgi:raffinose/stachyose/melibiose transport system permease protein
MTVRQQAALCAASTQLPRKRMLPVQRSQALLGLSLVVPGLALITLFVLVPAIQTIWYSFHRWDGFSPDMTFVGLRMYQQAIEGLGFSEALQHSLIWGAVALVVPPAIALVAAAIVEDSRIRWKSLFRFAFFLPYFFSMAVAGAIFTRVYDPSYGMLNQLLHVLGLDVAPQWLGDRSLAIWAAIGVFVWHETAFCFIVFAAAIQQLDRELYAAAKLDGANAFQVFRDVTIPGLRSITTFLMTVMLIGGLTPFAVIFALTTPGLGGPYYATEVLPTLIFKAGLQGSNVGQASALGVMLLIAVIAITLLFTWIRDRTAQEV